MRRTLFVVALLTALITTTGTGASAQVVPTGQFSGYSTGTAVHAGALQSGTTRLVDTEIAFSGANVDSRGLGAALSNEMTQAYQTAATTGDKAAGRGSGLEIGLTTEQANITNANQINPGTTVQAFAPVSTGLLSSEFQDVDVDPLVAATLLRGQAQAIYDNNVCVLGQPISSGLGYAANASLVNAGAGSVLATSTGNDAVNQSRSFTYLIPNGDGTYGLVTETHQILAPIVLLPTAGIPAAVITFAGEWVLRSTATGRNGGATVTYAPGGDPTSTTPVLTLTLAGQAPVSFTTQDLLTQEGLVIPIAGLGEIALGEDPRAIGGNADSSPELAANGTVAAAAVDVVRITASPVGQALGLTDLRVGHMESRAMVPAGGIKCGIPVSKTGTPASVVAGEEQVMTYTITVPADAEAFKAVACDLVNLKVTDVVVAEPGVEFDIVSASRNGVISNNSVTWDLGTYTPGSPPIVLTVGVTVPAGSAAGRITDTATATSVLGNCRGNASANSASLAGLAKLDASALTGSTAFGSNATVPAAVLSDMGATPIGGVQTGAGGTSQVGGDSLPAVAAGLGCLGLLGLVVARRRRPIGH